MHRPHLRLPGEVYASAVCFLLVILMINGWRVYFLLNQLANLDRARWLTYGLAFYKAFPLDSVVAGYFVLPVILTLYLPILGWHSQLYKRGLSIYMALVGGIISFLNLGDVSFFEEFGTHLNLLAVQHNATQHDTLQYIWNNYPVILYSLVILVIAGGLLLVLRKIIALIPDTSTRWWERSLSALITLALLFTALRGGWQERPVDWGKAMFSDHPQANQIALNPIFFFGRSIMELSSEKNLDKLLSFYDQAEALAETRQLLDSENLQFTDDVSLTRQFTAPERPSKPNIVLIVMESQVGEFCGFINPDMTRVTPNMDALAEQGIMFRKCFANGKRSAYGISSLMCSWPVLPGFPLISQLESARQIPTAGTILKSLGYETCFLYGGDADFDNMSGFLISNGFDRIVERNAFPAFTPGTTWGVFDHFVFDKAISLLDSSRQSLFLTLFTTTNHQPFTLPEEYENVIPSFDDIPYRGGRPLRTMAYVDHSIGEFIKKSRNHDWFDDTIFIFISDHGLTVHRDMFEDPRNAHIPFFIYAPAIIKTPEVIDRLVSQADVLPTMLSMIGYSGPMELFGRDALEEGPGFACRVSNDHILWAEDDLLYIEDLGQTSSLYQYGSLYHQPYEKVSGEDPRFKTIQKHCRAYLQTAYFSFKKH